MCPRYTTGLFGPGGQKLQRVVGLLENDNVMVWFWIGPHEQYETLLANL